MAASTRVRFVLPSWCASGLLLALARRGFILLGLLATLAQGQETPPIPAHPGRLEFRERTLTIPRAEPLTHRLSNGTRVVIVPDHSLPLVDIVVAIRAGGYLDPPDKPGLAEITGAMLRRGGTSSLTADAFDEQIDRLGAEINTRSTPTRSAASLDCLAATIERCLDLFFGMLRTPAFEAGRLEGLKSNVVSSLAARNDDPLAIMERNWAWLLVGEDHYLARQLTEADVGRLERTDLADFHRRYWRPKAAVIAVSGDLETRRVLELLEAHVARWSQGFAKADSAAPTPWPPEATATAAAPGLYLADHPTPQAKVSLGHGLGGHGLGGHGSAQLTDWLSPQAIALEVANEILGGTAGQVSRINGRLRGKGWVYRALSELDPGRYEPGSFRIFLDASPENVLRSLEVCLEEIERLGRAPVSARELEVVRQELLSALALRFDSAEETAGYFAEDLLLGRPHEYWYGYAERLTNLEARDLQSAARRYLRPESLRILIVGGGERVIRGGSRVQRLARWLSNPHRLPPRDPLTLLPLSPPEVVKD